jgi:hypothetical protein
MKILFLIAFVLSALVVFDTADNAQTKIRIRFAHGMSSAAVSGSISGYAYKDYIVRAAAGQEMKVKLDRQTRAVITILKPDGDNLEMGTETDEFDAALPVSGDYIVRVLMMRSEARRRGSFTNYRLTISIR